MKTINLLEKTKDLFVSFTDIMIENLKFEKVNYDSLGNLVDEIYKKIIKGLSENDTIKVSEQKLYINKTEETIDNINVCLNGIFYDKRKVEKMLSEFIKREKKKVFYIKKKKYELDKPSILELQSLYKKEIISLARNKRGDYSYKIKTGDETFIYNKDDLGKFVDYISEDTIKEVIRSSIETVFKEHAKNVIIPALATTAITSIIAPNNVYQVDKMEQVTHIIKEGENLSIIAKKYGKTVDELKKYNPGIDPNLIHPNQKLIVGYKETEEKKEDVSIENSKTKRTKKDIDDSYVPNDLYKIIDLSENNPTLDKIENVNDIDGVIIRSHNFVWKDDVLWKDKNYDDNLKKIKEIKEKNPNFMFGIYFVPDVRRECTVKDVKERALEVVNELNTLKEDSMIPNMPVYLDVEKYDKNSSFVEHNHLPEEITDDVDELKRRGLTGKELINKDPKFVEENYPTFYKMKLYVDILKEAGYECFGFYTSAAALKEDGYNLLIDYLEVPRECLWLADYGKVDQHVELNTVNSHNTTKYDGILHQISEGDVEGFDGYIDINTTNRNYREYMEKNGFNFNEKAQFNIIEYFKSLIFSDKEDMPANSLEKNSFYFEKGDYKYENGVIAIKINGKVINAHCDFDPKDYKEADPIAITDTNTGDTYSITKIKDGSNSFLIFAGSLVVFSLLRPTPLLKEFYIKLLSNAKRKIQDSKIYKK